MNLVIDIGNSRIKAAVFDNDRIHTVIRTEQLTEEILNPVLAQYDISAVIYSSVRAAGREDWINRLREKVKTCIPFTHATPVPVKNLYETPETLGCDRLAAAVGAHTLFPDSDCMIVDCGTAITIDFINSSGEFLGGNISPGLHIRFRALHDYTGKLPLGNVSGNMPVIGKNTEMAVTSGVLRGTLYEIERYMEKNARFNVILTGGDALFFAKNIKNPNFVVCNLVLIGLNKIVNYNNVRYI